MAGHFDLNKSSDGQFRFVLKADNGETLITSELYHTKASAENGIASVQKHSGSDQYYEMKVAANGKHYFNLKAANHQVIGTSQMYASLESCEGGMLSTKRNGPTASVKDNTAG